MRLTLWYGWNDDGGERELTKYPGEYQHSRLAREDEIDSHDAAIYLDRDAENENHHNLNGMHARVAGWIRTHGDEEVADKVMVELLKRGGLHGG